MATIYNSDVTNGLADTAKIQQARDKIPNQLAEKIVPVLSADPKRIVNIKATINRSTTGNSVVYSVPTNKDFYLTSAQLSFCQNATSDGTYGIMDANMGDGITNILDIRCLTLTACQDSVAITYNPPMKLLRGSAIRVLQSFSAGASVVAGCITGYTVED